MKQKIFIFLWVVFFIHLFSFEIPKNIIVKGDYKIENEIFKVEKITNLEGSLNENCVLKISLRLSKLNQSFKIIIFGSNEKAILTLISKDGIWNKRWKEKERVLSDALISISIFDEKKQKMAFFTKLVDKTKS